MIPRVIDFRLTSKCNMNCPFCFGTKASDSIDYDKIESFFSFFKLKGAKYVVISGGEPTLAKDFSRILTMLKRLGYSIALSSNGIFWKDDNIRKAVLENCKWLALPVDSSIEYVHNNMRNSSKNHFGMVMAILSELREKAPSIKVKIGTVVARQNYDSVDSILEVLPIEPDSWKLFQLSNTNYNYNYYKQYKIKDGEFKKLIQVVHKRYNKFNTRIDYSYSEERNGRYLFLEPDGNIAVINNNEEQVIGTYSDEGEELIEKIGRVVSLEKSINNFHNSFV